MQPSINSTSAQQTTQKHSLLGISSFTIAILADFVLILNILPKLDNNYHGISLSSTWYWTLLASSSILATIDLNKQNRRKLLPILALVLGVGIIGAVCIAAALMGI